MRIRKRKRENDKEKIEVVEETRIKKRNQRQNCYKKW